MREAMEFVLHSIEELQRLVDELAHGGRPTHNEVMEDVAQFLGRIESFVVNEGIENEDYLRGKLMEVESYIRYLTRGGEELDASRYQQLAHNGLNVIYRNIKNPVRGEYEDAGE